MGKGLLEVVLIAAEGLQDTHDSAKEKDSYVMVQYMGQKLKSKVSHGTYKFQVKNARAAKHRQKVIFKIKAGDDLVGEAICDITLGLEEGVCELPVCKYSVVLADQTSHGEIRVAVKFTANGLLDKRFGFKSFLKNFLSTLACSMPV